MRSPVILAIALSIFTTGCENAQFEARENERDSPNSVPTGSQVPGDTGDELGNESAEETEPANDTTPCEDTANDIDDPVSCEVHFTVQTFAQAEEIANCDIILGDLDIRGYDHAELPELALQELTGSLFVNANPSLESIDGLLNLEVVGEHVKITDNALLESVAGLMQIEIIPGELYVMDNPMLTSLHGLDGLEVVQGRLLKISENALCDDLLALKNLRTIGGALSVWGNPLLTSLEGLQNLASIGAGDHEAKNLEINYNASLVDVSALENISEIRGDLQVAGNASLESLDGLLDVTRVDGSFVVINNPHVSHCEVLGMQAAIENSGGIHGSVTVFGNGNPAEEECDTP